MHCYRILLYRAMLQYVIPATLCYSNYARPPAKNHYATLGVRPAATPAEVKKALLLCLLLLSLSLSLL